LSLSPLRQAVLESIAWNYGSFQSDALSTLLADLRNNSSNNQVADDIQALAASGLPENANRRSIEADLFRWEPLTNLPPNGPVVIKTLSDLLSALQNFNLSGNFVLDANIDATGITIAPIGSSSNPFTGTFEGNGHTINGLHVVGNGTYVGLFAEVGSAERYLI
jgi:hypothetical protein